VQERSRRTVARILEAAAQLFGELGSHATTTNDIAAAAGVSIGSLYQYFPDKGEILTALYALHLERVGPEVVTACRSDPDASADEWVEGLVRVLVVANVSNLDRVLYSAMAEPASMRGPVDELVSAMAKEARRHLHRWGVAEPARRARFVVTTAVSIVHEVVIQLPAGRRRKSAECDLVRMLVGFIDGSAAPRSAASTGPDPSS
jgi:AcrR family transcriptional regulator